MTEREAFKLVWPIVKRREEAFERLYDRLKYLGLKNNDSRGDAMQGEHEATSSCLGNLETFLAWEEAGCPLDPEWLEDVFPMG